MRNTDIVLIEVDGPLPVFHRRDLRGYPLCRTPDMDGLVGVTHTRALEHGGSECGACRREHSRHRHLTPVA